MLLATFNKYRNRLSRREFAIVIFTVSLLLALLLKNFIVNPYLEFRAKESTKLTQLIKKKKSLETLSAEDEDQLNRLIESAKSDNKLLRRDLAFIQDLSSADTIVKMTLDLIKDNDKGALIKFRKFDTKVVDQSERFNITFLANFDGLKMFLANIDAHDFTISELAIESVQNKFPYTIMIKVIFS